MKQSEKIVLIILFFFIVLSGFLFYRYLNLSQKKSEQKTPSQISVSPTPTPKVIRRPEELPVVKKDETTGKEIIEIPFNYLVKSVDSEKIVLQKPGGGEKDIITYPQSLFPVIKVFKSSPQGTTAASLSDITVGQRIKVRNINRGEEIQFYIIQ